MSGLHAFLALAPLLAACAAPGGAPAPAAAAKEPVEPVSPPQPVESDVARADPAPGLSGTELAIWNDPAFRKRFAESYLAETEIEPRVTIAERDLLTEVFELMSSDRLAEAAQRVQKERNATSSAVLDFTLANILFQQEKLEPAAAAYRSAVEKYPKFRRAWYNLGLIHVRQGHHSEALPALTRAVELGATTGLGFGLLGVAYSSTGQYLSAESAFRMATLLDPESVDWKMGLAESFFRQERFADAAALCENLIAQQPDNARFWLIQGNAFVGLQQPERAAEDFEVVDRLGGSTPDSLNMLGDIYSNQELFDLAVDAYLRALEQDPGKGPDRALRAARFLGAAGAQAETARLLDGVESQLGEQLQDADRRDLLKMRSRLALAAGAGEEEARLLEEVVALDPLDGDALILLAEHSSRGGDTAQAIFYYERAASLEEFEARAKLGHGQLLVREAKYAEALPLLRRAQALHPRESVQRYLEQVERIAQSR